MSFNFGSSFSSGGGFNQGGQSNQGKNQQPCKFFNSPGGCNKGNNCPYLHVQNNQGSFGSGSFGGGFSSQGSFGGGGGRQGGGKSPQKKEYDAEIVQFAPMPLQNDQEKSWYCKEKEAKVIADLSMAPPWPFTSYAMDAGHESIIKYDHSFEEVRWMSYQAAAQNAIPQHMQAMVEEDAKVQALRKDLKDKASASIVSRYNELKARAGGGGGGGAGFQNQRRGHSHKGRGGRGRGGGGFGGGFGSMDM